jgi:hypothetical protein
LLDLGNKTLLCLHLKLQDEQGQIYRIQEEFYSRTI